MYFKDVNKMYNDLSKITEVFIKKYEILDSLIK